MSEGLTAFKELEEDVAAPDELAVDVALRDGGPVAEALDLGADQGVAKDVERLELGVHGPESSIHTHTWMMGRLICAQMGGLGCGPD